MVPVVLKAEMQFKVFVGKVEKDAGGKGMLSMQTSKHLEQTSAKYAHKGLKAWGTFMHALCTAQNKRLKYKM